MKYGFVVKATIVVLLVALFDQLFPDWLSGARIGAFAGAWLIGVIIARRDVRRSRSALIALAGAGLFVAALVNDPGLLAWALFWSALSIAVLVPRSAGFDDAWHWAGRLVLHAATGLVAPFRDMASAWRRRRNAGQRYRTIVRTLALPVIGGALFLALFAIANPIIAQLLSALHLPSLRRVLLWMVVAIGLWPSVRPHRLVMRWAARLPMPEPILPGTSLPSVLIALAVFNAIFAVQNGLDLVFLWQGGALPAGMTQAEYAHRGAYPLIVTALIAGAMALSMLRPGSASERHPGARRLVTLWVAQNLVLVASSALRAIAYIQESMLTAWRIAALLWMALVALGLILICWRILRGRSARWLMNWNAAAAIVVLSACTFVDLGAVAAAWNVRAHAPARIDLCYLSEVGDGAVLPMIRLEQREMDAVTRDRLRYVRSKAFNDLAQRQARWGDWTVRDAVRLAEARRLLGGSPPQPMVVVRPAWRGCDGSVRYPAPPVSTS